MSDRLSTFVRANVESLSLTSINFIRFCTVILLCIYNGVKLAVALKCSKFIFVGSNQEYLKDMNSIDGKASYSSVYGACKAACREICCVMAREKMQFCATAFTNVFGWGDYSKRTANLFISKLLKGESLDLIMGENLYDWTYIDDAVRKTVSIQCKNA